MLLYPNTSDVDGTKGEGLTAMGIPNSISIWGWADASRGMGRLMLDIARSVFVRWFCEGVVYSGLVKIVKWFVGLGRGAAVKNE